MSFENGKKQGSPRQGAGKRRYEKRKRAEHEARTRLRITEAAVKLHGTVGPARTTMSAVAEEAGVQRATLYRHFPSEEALFQACSSHWSAQHPPPDPTHWAEIADPDARLRSALDEVYRYYEGGEEMLEKTTRDAALVPAMQAPMDAYHAYLGAVRDLLASGRPERGAARRRARAAIGHALRFETWQSLVRDQGLSRREAVEMMTRLAG